MTVYKKNKSYMVDVQVNGKRVQRIALGARTKAEAEKVERLIRTQMFEQTYGLEEKTRKNFTEFVNERFLTYSKQNKRTYRDDISKCKPLVAFFGEMNLSDITSALIEKYKQQRIQLPTLRRTAKRQPSTVNREFATLSKIFSLAVDDDLIKMNPCRKIKRLREDNSRTRILSDEEIPRLMQSLEFYPQLKNIVIFALQTACRKSEILNLKWQDVDFERRRININRTKSGKPKVLPINEVLLKMLLSIEKNNDFVFPSAKTGNRIIEFKRIWKKTLERAGIKDFNFHDLRHTSATILADAGMNVFALRDFLGHSDVRMTARYTHGIDQSTLNALEKLSAKTSEIEPENLSA